jgi:hypothetical protein
MHGPKGNVVQSAPAISFARIIGVAVEDLAAEAEVGGSVVVELGETRAGFTSGHQFLSP